MLPWCIVAFASLVVAASKFRAVRVKVIQATVFEAGRAILGSVGAVKVMIQTSDNVYNFVEGVAKCGAQWRRNSGKSSSMLVCTLVRSSIFSFRDDILCNFADFCRVIMAAVSAGF